MTADVAHGSVDSREREHEIRRLAVHETQHQNELAAYHHAVAPVEEMLRKHTGYTDCPLYQRIQQDIRRRIVEAAAAGNAGISGAPAVNTDL